MGQLQKNVASHMHGHSPRKHNNYENIQFLTSLLFSFSSRLVAFCMVIDMASPLAKAVRTQ
jgi:hypothetical protein